MVADPDLLMQFDAAGAVTGANTLGPAFDPATHLTGWASLQQFATSSIYWALPSGGLLRMENIDLNAGYVAPTFTFPFTVATLIRRSDIAGHAGDSRIAFEWNSSNFVRIGISGYNNTMNVRIGGVSNWLQVSTNDAGFPNEHEFESISLAAGEEILIISRFTSRTTIECTFRNLTTGVQELLTGAIGDAGANALTATGNFDIRLGNSSLCDRWLFGWVAAWPSTDIGVSGVSDIVASPYQPFASAPPPAGGGHVARRMPGLMKLLTATG